MPGIAFHDLPTEIPVFPLSGALLLPDSQLPLNIFEPRYLEMTEAALARGRFLGMVQPRPKSGKEEQNFERIYDVGCLGRISAFAELDDGRYLITLSGFSRFKIVEELDIGNSWRTVIADYSPYRSDLEKTGVEGFLRQPFIDTLQAYFATHKIKGSWEAIESADEATLITSVAMAAPLSPLEKQAILECQSVIEQGQMLQSLMEMAVHIKEGGEQKIHH